MLGLFKRQSADPAAAKAGEHETVDTFPCRFFGTTAEYFEIWVVNILLTTCSLGFFRPWANARKHQYFYAKTSVGKHQFGYGAAAKQSIIFAAAIPALVLSMAAALLFEPTLTLPIIAVAALVYPFYRHHGLVQHVAATSYRGRRFSYCGSVKDSYVRLVAWPVLTVVLAFFPLGHSLRSSWGNRFEKYSYSEQRFTSKLLITRMWALVAVTALTAFVAVALVVVSTGTYLVTHGGDSAVEHFINTLLGGRFKMNHGVVLLAFVLVSALPLAVWRATSEQLLCAGVQLEAGVSFDTEMSATKLSGLYFTNLIAVLLSAGFAIPWATVRVARYRASVSKLICYTDIEELVGDKAAGIKQLKQAAVDVSEADVPDDEMHSALDTGELDLPVAA